MLRSPLQIVLSSPDATASLARHIGKALEPGDTLLLSGGIGAGKTHFARALIQSLQDQAEDVPSPTFTLVQVYETRAGELWHTDLYRLTHPDEMVELGLLDAFEDAVCLVEWPDRLGDLAPEGALRLAFEMGEGQDDRRLVLSWTDNAWEKRLSGVLNAFT